jgi:hypothetical protein
VPIIVPSAETKDFAASSFEEKVAPAPVVEEEAGPAGAEVEDEATAGAEVVKEKEPAPVPVVEKEGTASDKKEDSTPFDEVDAAPFKEMEVPAPVVEEEAAPSPIAEEIMNEGLAPEVVELPVRASDEATPLVGNKPEVASTPKESPPTEKITAPGEEAAIATSGNPEAPGGLVPHPLPVESTAVDLDVPVDEVSATAEVFPTEVSSPLMVDTPEVVTSAANPEQVESGDFPGVVAEKIDPAGSAEAKKTVENSWRDFMEEMENESITPALAAPIA